MERSEAPICVNSTANNSPCKQNKQKTHLKVLTGEKPDQALADYSQKDSKWDTQRAVVQQMSDFLFEVQRFEKWAERMDGCAVSLGFGEAVDTATGEIKPKLINTNFCHCRHCQLCDGRRSLVRMNRFRQALPSIEQEHPKARWILLTLTVPNRPVNELRAQLKEMNAAWNRLRLRKQFKPVLGWIRATEVTQEKTRKDHAHPHFHCLLLVPSSMLGGKYYVKQSEWLDLWRSCMRDDSITSVDVRAIKGGAMKGAVETLKAFNYSMKVNELINRTPEWILEYMEQVNHLRFIAAGGVLKDALKKIEEDATDEEMLCVDDEKESEVTEVVKRFSWRSNEKKYRLQKGWK